MASILPATSDIRRPSKSLIVNKSLAFVEDALSRETLYRNQIQEVGSQNDSLRSQLNKLRKDQGLKPMEAREEISLPIPLSDVVAAKERAPVAPVELVGEMDEAEEERDDVSGDGESSPQPTSQIETTGHGLPQNRYQSQFGFAPAPIAPQFYNNLFHHQLQHQQQHYSTPVVYSPGLPMSGHYASQPHPQIQPQVQGQVQAQSQGLSQHSSSPCSSSQYQQPQHFESAMDVSGKMDIHGVDHQDKMPSSLMNHHDDDYSNHFDYGYYNHSNDFTPFSGTNFGGFANNVLLEA